METPEENSFEDMLASAIEKSNQVNDSEEENDEERNELKCKTKGKSKNSGDKYADDSFIR